MEIPKNVRESLKDLGFTDYETALYITLVTQGPMNAKDLSKASKVPYSRIYQILQTLIDKNFIIRDEESRPTMYHATPPSEALKLARERQIREVENKTRKLLEELNPIFLMKALPQKMELYYLEGNDKCMLQIGQLLGRAEDSVWISTSSADIVRTFYEKLEKARFRGISNIKVLIQSNTLKKNNEEDMDLLEKYKKISELRTAPLVFGTLVIIDGGKDAFFMYKKYLFGDGTYTGILLENPLIGALFREWFGTFFRNASPA